MALDRPEVGKAIEAERYIRRYSIKFHERYSIKFHNEMHRQKKDLIKKEKNEKVVCIR